MDIEVHLHFCGQCQEAFEFYQDVMGAEIEFIQTFGDSPAAELAPDGWQD